MGAVSDGRDLDELRRLAKGEKSGEKKKVHAGKKNDDTLGEGSVAARKI